MRHTRTPRRSDEARFGSGRRRGARARARRVRRRRRPSAGRDRARDDRLGVTHRRGFSFAIAGRAGRDDRPRDDGARAPEPMRGSARHPGALRSSRRPRSRGGSPCGSGSARVGRASGHPRTRSSSSSCTSSGSTGSSPRTTDSRNGSSGGCRQASAEVRANVAAGAVLYDHFSRSTSSPTSRPAGPSPRTAPPRILPRRRAVRRRMGVPRGRDADRDADGTDRLEQLGGRAGADAVPAVDVGGLRPRRTSGPSATR